MTERFVPGLELSRRLYLDAVAPLLAAHLPTLRHTAALVGSGFEVLGYDTARSTDHDWGPRLQLFLTVEDSLHLGPDLTTMLSRELPKSILGYPTHLVVAENGSTRHMTPTDGPVAHGIEVTDLGSWFTANLGFDPRTAVTTPPYSKWLGSAFARLPDAAHLAPHLVRAMSALRAPEREDALASAYEHSAQMQNELKLAPYVDPTTRPFHDRPFRVLHAERFADALHASITDPAIRELPLVGAADQWVDNTTATGRHKGLRQAQRDMAT